MKKCIMFLVTVSLCLALSSCALLPQEETHRETPVIKDSNIQAYKYAVCTRSDMALTVGISCSYVPVRTQGMKFKMSGLRYEEICVAVGDTVREGDVLVRLETGDIEDQIRSYEWQIENLNLQITQLEENRTARLQRLDLQRGGMSADSYKAQIKSVNSSYDSSVEGCQNQIHILEMYRNDCMEKLNDRTLRAPFDGVVTYVRSVNDESRSSANDNIVTIADSTLSLFRAKTEHWDLFQPGDEVTIVSKKVDYPAVVTSEEELGLPVSKKETGKDTYVYFVLLEPSFDLKDNDRGSITIVMDYRENALQIPLKATHTINGETIVYYENEFGFKSYKTVELGLVANKMVEVLSGLEEGDRVITG